MKIFPHAKQRINPYPFYMNMRNLHPIEYDDNSHAWGVFRYKDIENILNDHENFSSDLQKWQYPDHQEIQNKKNLITSDPPLHNQLYNQISSSFNSSIVSELEYRIEQIAKEILNHVIENENMDLITDVAYPLPITIIAELLGIPPEDQQLYKKWVNGLVREEGGTVINPISKVTVQIQQEMNSYLQKVIQKHREEEKPHTGFISNMLRGWSYHNDDEEHEEAEREVIRSKRNKEHSLMSEERILSFCSQLLIAGYMTTTNLIGNVFLSLLENPQEFKQLQENRSLIPSAIEETLRYRSPIQSIFRFAVNDNINIGGKMISSGQKVILWLGSANRDETVFNNPDRFDIRRDTRAHLAFGSGIHFCIGAPLARLEARVILEVMLQQLQNVTLNDSYDQKQLEPVDSLVFHGVKHLPLKFKPR